MQEIARLGDNPIYLPCSEWVGVPEQVSPYQLEYLGVTPLVKHLWLVLCSANVTS